MSIEFSPAFDDRRHTTRGMGAPPMQLAAPAALPPVGAKLVFALRPERKRAKTSFAPTKQSGRPPRAHGGGAHATRKVTSPRRVAANRRNAQRSTGPRTAAGKRRASRNALKHGLCSPYACLEGECAATYATFVREVEEELQPRTPLQRSLVPHIANLMWRIDRLPQAQADLFQLELKRCAKRESLTASQVIARRFSADPSDNGFLLLGRYERGLHNQLHRLLARFDLMQRRRPTTPWPPGEPPVPDEMDRPAWTDEKLAAQIAWFDAQQRAKRTQSNPGENRDGESETRESTEIDVAPATERTHCDDDAAPRPLDPCQSRPLPLASSAPKIHAIDAIRRDDIQER